MTAKVEKSSIDWKEIRQRYEQEPCSIRALGRENGTSDTAIHRRAESEGWRRYSAPPSLQQPPQRRGCPAPGPDRTFKFETRCDALDAGLRRLMAKCENAEDSYYCDIIIVQMLLWSQTPVADMAAAIELTEEQLFELCGVVIFRHWRDVHGIKLDRNAARRVAAADKQIAARHE